MAQTIPCDLCQEFPALILVTFIPNADTQGLGLECIGPWAEAIAQAVAAQGEENLDPEAVVFRITAIPTGDEELLTIGEALVWAENMVRAIEAQEAAQAAGPGVEPITAPDRPKGRRRAQKGPSGPVAPPPPATDEEWEESGLAGRPPLSDVATGTDGAGPGVEAGEAPPADDGR